MTVSLPSSSSSSSSLLKLPNDFDTDIVVGYAREEWFAELLQTKYETD